MSEAYKTIEREKYLMRIHRSNNLVSDLNGAMTFNKLDLLSGHSHITTFSTHVGPSRNKRLGVRPYCKLLGFSKCERKVPYRPPPKMTQSYDPQLESCLAELG